MKKFNGQYTEEAELLDAVKKWLEPQRRRGVHLIRVVDRYTKGYSDLFINAHGRFIAVELKDDTGVASPHQEAFIEDVIAAGGAGGICRTVQEVANLIDNAVYCYCPDKQNVGMYCTRCGKIIRRGVPPCQ